MPRKWESYRPENLTPEQRDKALGIYMAGGGPALCGAALGMSRRKFERIVETHPELEEQIRDAKEFSREYGIKCLFEMGTTGKPNQRNVAALIFWLKNNAGYSDRREINGRVEVDWLPRLLAGVFEENREAIEGGQAQRALPAGGGGDDNPC